MEKTDKRLANLRSYQKGQIGNPSGRPKIYLTLSEFLAATDTTHPLELTLRRRNAKGGYSVYKGQPGDEQALFELLGQPDDSAAE